MTATNTVIGGEICDLSYLPYLPSSNEVSKIKTVFGFVISTKNELPNLLSHGERHVVN